MIDRINEVIWEKVIPAAALLLVTIIITAAVAGLITDIVNAQSDNFEGVTNIQAPAQRAVAITTSDTVNLNFVCRGVYVGGDGDVVAVMTSGDVATFSNAVAGSVLPLRVKRINATNTTATNLVCVW